MWSLRHSHFNRKPSVLFIPILIGGILLVLGADQKIDVRQSVLDRHHQANQERAQSGYEIKHVLLHEAPESRMPSPLMVAGGVGAGLATMGVAGALMLFRSRQDEAEDEFHGDDEIRGLVARHEGR